KAEAARRVSETYVYRHGGHRSAAHHLAAVSGSSVGAAKAELQAAERLKALPATAAAQREGKLSPEKAAAIADAATAEAGLLDKAEQQALAEVRDGCNRAKASAKGKTKRRRKRVRSSVPTKIIFRVDWEAYKRGHTQGQECCDIASVGPVPVSAVKAAIDNGDPFIAAVLMDTKDVMGVAHLGRRPNAYQLTTLEW